jgi:hypothetical protein
MAIMVSHFSTFLKFEMLSQLARWRSTIRRRIKWKIKNLEATRDLSIITQKKDYKFFAHIV